jgi:hypothetical protein
MKIIPQFTSVLLASSLFMSAIPKAQATPAVLAPVALCSTGVGCILVGTMAVGAVTYYVWEYGGGKRVVADISGRVLKSDFGDHLPESEAQPNTETETVTAQNAGQALQKCKQIAKTWGGVLKPGNPRSIGKGLFLCEFTVWR